MGKAKHKARPSMPLYYWLEQDGCWYCKDRNNCNQCKAIRKSVKRGGMNGKKRNRRQRLSVF